MAIAVFDYAAWSARYPEFGGAVGQDLAASLFAEAGLLYLDNSDASPVQDVNRRLLLLNMLVAHLAALSGIGSSRDSGAVGRISSASEGSVSVTFDSGLMPGTAAWYQQTSYGLSFWQATKSARMGQYVPTPAAITDPWRAARWRR